MVAEFGSRENESGLQQADRTARTDCVEVLALNAVNLVVCKVHRDFVEVSEIALQDEKEEILLFMDGIANAE